MSQQPRPLWLSKEALDSIRELVRGRTQIQVIFDACSAQNPASSVMALAAKVAKYLQLDSVTVYEALVALWNLRRFHKSSNLPAEEFLTQISGHLARQTSRMIDEETRAGWNETSKILAPILPELGDEHQLFISQKAQSLAYSHENLFMSARLITDLRPVFDETGKQIHETMILHTLSIQYVNGHGPALVADFALDADDLRMLAEQCDRAQAKLATCHHALQAAGLTPVVVPETGDDA